MNTISRFASIAAVGAGLTLFSAHAGGPANLIVNGDFETGTLAGWNAINVPSGRWEINNGSLDPIGPLGPLPPITGSFDVISAAGGPGFHALRQTIVIPANVVSAQLSWQDRIHNWAAAYSDHSQEYRVQIKNSTGVVLLQEVFSTNPGDPLQQPGPNARSADLTGFFQAHAGESVIVSFEEQDQTNIFNVTLDDIRLLVSQPPLDKGECKSGGWETFVNVITGQPIFKNQGDCVSFVATGGSNPPAYQQ